MLRPDHPSPSSLSSPCFHLALVCFEWCGCDYISCMYDYNTKQTNEYQVCELSPNLPRFESSPPPLYHLQAASLLRHSMDRPDPHLRAVLVEYERNRGEEDRETSEEGSRSLDGQGVVHLKGEERLWKTVRQCSVRGRGESTHECTADESSRCHSCC